MIAAAKAAMPVVVTDGNHEVWPCLSQFMEHHDGRPETAALRCEAQFNNRRAL